MSSRVLESEVFFIYIRLCNLAQGRPRLSLGRWVVMAVSSVTDMLKVGIESCRRGDWNEGLRNLGLIAAMGDEAGTLPGVFYSYLGYGIARKEKRIQEGLRLCRHAIE